MKKILIGFVFLGLSAFFAPSENTVQAQQIPVLEFFHGAECPHCHKEKAWLPTLQKMYPNLQIKEYEVWHVPENRLLMQKRLDEIGKESGAVPTNIIGDDVIVGFNPEGIIAAMRKHYGDPVPGVASDTTGAGTSSLEGGSNTVWIVLAGVMVIAVVGGYFVFGKEKS